MESPHELDPRAISPELALVDPELARLLQSQLPPPQWELQPATAVRPIGPAVAPTPAVPRRRPRRLLQSVAIAAAALIATLIVLTIRDLVGSDSTPVSSTASENVRASAKNAAQAPRGQRPVRAKQRAHQAPATHRARSAASPGSATRAASPATPRKQRSTAQVPQIRNLVWAPSAGARSYGVRVVRGANVVFEGNTAEARLTLALRPGAYHWYVWALRPDGTRSAQLVDASLVVTAQA